MGAKICFVFLRAGNSLPKDTKKHEAPKKRLSQKPKKGCRHCGLDPQSPDNKAVFFRRSRVKRGMTLF
jgi:hypothetical protein